ncbi:unnamed protein product, partial [Candidula unifasciata]
MLFVILNTHTHTHTHTHHTHTHQSLNVLSYYLIIIMINTDIFSVDPQSIPDEENLRSLSELLLVRQSILDLISKSSSASVDKDLESEDPTDKSRLTKRVFCNGFTGCGGRFRGRRRQQQPVAEIGKRLLPNFRKRPFCNSYGCYNSGKKRFSPGPNMNEVSKMTPLTDGMLHERIKKLFCNGYGGCQNLGKRVVLLDAALAKAVSDQDKLSFPLTTRSLLSKLEGIKRMFTSDFDDQVDNLISRMR